MHGSSLKQSSTRALSGVRMKSAAMAVGAVLAGGVLVSPAAAQEASPSSSQATPSAVVPAPTAPAAMDSAPAVEPASSAAVEPAAAATPVAAPPVEIAPPPVVDDPLQKFNRASYGFSMGVDRALIRPITHGYMKVTPTPVRHGVSNVLYNLGEPGTFLNDVAQGHPKRAGVTTSRFVINSTIGLLGLFDVAAGMGLPSHDGDFGQTLGRYGVKSGPFLYVPIIGPLSFREGVGRTVDFFTDPVGIVGGGYTTTFGATRLGATVIDTRANADNAFRALDDAVDPYTTARSAYTQHRAALVREATGEVEALPDFDTPSPTP